MMKLRELMRSREKSSGPECECECECESEEVDNRPVLGYHSKTLGIPPTKTRPGRASNVHSMLVRMREENSTNNALTEEERTASQGQRIDASKYEKTMKAAQQFALKERNRNLQGDVHDKTSLVNTPVSKPKNYKQRTVQFTSQQMKKMLAEDKENMTEETQKDIKSQLYKDSKHFFKLSTQGDLKGSVDKGFAPAYRHNLSRGGAAVQPWVTPSQSYLPSVRPSAPPPPPSKPKPSATLNTDVKLPPNCTYWTGNSNEDDNTLFHLLNKNKKSIKEKKKVRFDLPAVKQVRFNIPDRDSSEFSQDKASSQTSKSTQDIKKRPLSLQLQKDSLVNSVHSENYFTLVWTLLEDLFSDETVQWLNHCNGPDDGHDGDPDMVHTRKNATNLFAISAQSMTSFGNHESMRRVQLLEKGFEHVEILFHIPKPGARMKTTESREIHQEYSAAKELLLSQAFYDAAFPSESSSCFTEKYNKHWTFLCCLLADAILRKCVLHRDYALIDETGGMWENEKAESSRVHFWESKFEVVVGEVLGGEIAAGQLLSLREFSLLRQYFDVVNDDE